MTYAERFIEITEYYPHIFINQKEFSERLGYASASTVNSWMNGKTKDINAKNRGKICKIFQLSGDVWKRDLVTEVFLMNCFEDLELITKEIRAKSNIDKLIFDKPTFISKKEQEMLKQDLEDEVDLTEKTPEYLFAYAQKLKKDKKIAEALDVLEKIEEHDSSYKFTHYNQIEHLKAILFSHDKLKDWDRATTILKRLYSSAKYHLEEPEIITLIASNYKRKALYDKDKKTLLPINKVDMDLLVNAITLYQEAYALKDSNEKYYDAVNDAYLHNIIDAIEPEESSLKEIEELYAKLSRVWKIDKESWWHVSSNAEFLMLLGKIDLAILEINDFLELHIKKIDSFEMDATLRQLEIYIHFTQDKNAIKYAKNLKESWNFLSLG